MALSFDVDRLTATAQRERLAANWAGIGCLGANLSYDLSSVYAPGTSGRYELRFQIRLADDERSD